MNRNTAYAPFLVETHLQITEVLDGDSVKVSSMFKKNEKEIRLYGIDAPENKVCRKLREDEKENTVSRGVHYVSWKHSNKISFEDCATRN